jgi:nitroreductase
VTTSRTTEYPVDPLFTDRWSPRALTGEAIDEPTLLSFLEAARWAPSSSNIQPWRFLYGRAGTAAWTPIFDALVPFNQGWAQRASALVAVLSITHSTAPGASSPSPVPTHAFDTGAAWASLAFQAHLSGWITHGMAGFDHAKLRAGLGIPDDVATHAVIAIGKLGDKAILPEPLQAREAPSGRLPLKAIAAEGPYAF